MKKSFALLLPLALVAAHCVAEPIRLIKDAPRLSDPFTLPTTALLSDGSSIDLSDGVSCAAEGGFCDWETVSSDRSALPKVFTFTGMAAGGYLTYRLLTRHKGERPPATVTPPSSSTPLTPTVPGNPGNPVPEGGTLILLGTGLLTFSTKLWKKTHEK